MVLLWAKGRGCPGMRYLRGMMRSTISKVFDRALMLGVLSACMAFGATHSAHGQLREGEWVLSTFNIRYDNPSDPLTWVKRRDEVAKIVGFYDIVGIQEALPHQVLDLAQRFENNFKKFAESATDDMKRGALRVSEVTGVLKD